MTPQAQRPKLYSSTALQTLRPSGQASRQAAENCSLPEPKSFDYFPFLSNPFLQASWNMPRQFLRPANNLNMDTRDNGENAKIIAKM